jgi:hypothetical protein
MSTKRARYDGAYEEVAVYDPQADVYAGPIDIVQRGGLLSADVPARIRDELLDREDWSEVKQATPATAKNDDRKGDA